MKLLGKEGALNRGLRLITQLIRVLVHTEETYQTVS